MKKINTLLLLLVITVSTIFAKSTLNLTVVGMHCGGCEAKFKAKATDISGISEVTSVSSAHGTAIIEYDEKVISAEKIIQTLAEETGYTITTLEGIKTTTAEGKPTACCQKGQKDAACADKGRKAKK